MVKPTSKRAAAARRKEDAAALREEAEAALKLDREGRHGEAIARVDDLAARHRGSALVLHLAGHVHHAAARRVGTAGDEAATLRHVVAAYRYLAEAKRLVPNCIAISSLLAAVLFLGTKAVEAEREAREAVSIADPVDPADNSVLFIPSSTKEQRVEECRKAARASLDAIAGYIPRIAREILAAADGHGDEAREALKRAKDLAKRCPSSSRAQLLSAHMQIQRLRLLGPGMDRRPILGPVRVALEEAIANSFGASLVLALFHAKLCFVLCLYETAYLSASGRLPYRSLWTPSWRTSLLTPSKEMSLMIEYVLWKKSSYAYLTGSFWWPMISGAQ